jgi:hypothetical protein
LELVLRLAKDQAQGALFLPQLFQRMAVVVKLKLPSLSQRTFARKNHVTRLGRASATPKLVPRPIDISRFIEEQSTVLDGDGADLRRPQRIVRATAAPVGHQLGHVLHASEEGTWGMGLLNRSG